MWSVPPFVSPSNESFTQSLWHATAAPGPVCPPLASDSQCDVVVVGAGYTGLTTAIELASRGRAVTVLDAREPGFGASGRNGGQVIPLFKYEPDEVLARYGDQIGTGILDLVREAPQAVFRYVRTHGIDCELTANGWIQVAEGGAGAAALQARCEAYRRRGDAVRWLDRAALRDMTGSDHYTAGWLMEGAGAVQPLAYARGLARAAQKLGVTIHGNTLAQDLTREHAMWRVRTDRGSVRAPAVVLATNAYTTAQLWPGLHASIVPLYSIQIATEPLDAAIGASILPGRQSVSDTRRLTTYHRRDAAGRFVIGARGPFRARPPDGDAERLRRNAIALYPALAGARFSHAWSGRVAVTTDHVPHLHRLAPGVLTALGYNGRGVAMASIMGSVLAAACLDGPQAACRYPVSPLRRIPLHAFHRLGVQAVISYYRMLDTMA